MKKALLSLLAVCLLPFFLSPSGAFYAEPLADGISAVSSTASPSFPNLEIYGYTGPRLWKGNRWNTAFPKMFRSSIMPTSW